MNKLVSVVIPTYGGGQFLERCVDSVLAQTYPNIEIIVVDDNGINTPHQIATSNVMKKYLSYQNVKYICHKININGSAARNTGVKNSLGEYIALLDDDDIFLPDNIKQHMIAFEKLDDIYALTTCGTEYYKDNKKINTSIPHMDGKLLFELLSSKFTIGSSTLCVRRDAYDFIGGFDESFRRHQDMEFTARIASKYLIKSIPVIGRRKYIEKRNSAKNPEQFETFRLHYLQKMEPYIKSFPIKEQRIIYVNHLFPVAKEYFKKYGAIKFIEKYYEYRLGIDGIKKIIENWLIILKRRKLKI